MICSSVCPSTSANNYEMSVCVCVSVYTQKHSYTAFVVVAAAACCSSFELRNDSLKSEKIAKKLLNFLFTLISNKAKMDINYLAKCI